MSVVELQASHEQDHHLNSILYSGICKASHSSAREQPHSAACLAAGVWHGLNARHLLADVYLAC